MKKLLLLFSLLFLGCEGLIEAPVKVFYHETPKSLVPFGPIDLYRTVSITSTVDEVKITDVIINRGNCQTISNKKQLPVKLKFGQKLDWLITRNLCGDVLEAEIQTDLGDWTFNFEY